MFCKYCGKQIKDESRFCVYCGKSLVKNIEITKVNEEPIPSTNDENNVSINMPSVKIEPVEIAQVEVAPVVTDDTTPIVEKPVFVAEETAPVQEKEKNIKSGKSRKPLIILIVVILLIALLGAGAFYVYYTNPDILDSILGKSKQVEVEVDEEDEEDEEDHNIEEKEEEEEPEELKEDDTDSNDDSEDTENIEDTESNADIKDEEASDEEEQDTDEETILVDLLSKEELGNILDSYSKFLSDTFDNSKLKMKAVFINDDSIPELFVNVDSNIYVIGYSNGQPSVVLTTNKDQSQIVYDTSKGRITVVGAKDNSLSWFNVYSVADGSCGLLEGAQMVTDYSIGAITFYKTDVSGALGEAITQAQYDEFRGKYPTDNCIIFDSSSGMEKKTVEEAYNALVGSTDKSSMKGSDVTKIPVDEITTTTVLEAESVDGADYDPSNMLDGNINTAWAEGAEGVGKDEVITIHLNGTHKVSAIKLYNGFMSSKRRYAINGKVSKIEIDYGTGTKQIVSPNVMDTPEEEVFFMDSELGQTIIKAPDNCVTDTITITITDAKAGSKYEDTCISEIEIYGR